MQIPFQAACGATAGNTVAVVANATPTSVAGTLASLNWPTILITNSGGVTVFVRLSSEATPTATAKDVPILAGAQLVVSNPVPFGAVGLACLSITTTAATVYFTPGVGGI